jgi:uncharacterized protein involved in exopolysaccharide biosynthesis
MKDLVFKMKFSELQQKLKEKFGIDHLADIARELGVSPQAVSNWKARDRVPYKYVLKIRQQLEESNNQVSDQSVKNAPESNLLSPQDSYPQYVEEDTLSLSDILLVLARQVKIIIITPLILCTLTIIYVLFVAQPVFESSAKIMSSSGGSGGSQAAGLAAQFGISLPAGQTETKWIYPEIIKSRTLARAMLKRKFNTEKYGLQKTLLQILAYDDKNPAYGIDNLELLAIGDFINMISLSEDLKSGIYTITISGPEPKFVKELNTALIEELDSHQQEYNKAETSETRKFIQERIADTRQELETAEEALKDFNDRNRRIENSPALQLDRHRLAREVSVLTGVFTTLKQQLETTKIEEVKESNYVFVLDPPEVPLQRSKPKRKIKVILAGLFGIGLGTIIAFIKEYVENSGADEQKKIVQAKLLIMSNFSDFLPKRFKKNQNEVH